MDLATFLVIVGVWEFLIGVALLVSPMSVNNVIKNSQKNQGTMCLLAWIWITLPALVLYQDPTIGTDLEGVLRLITWLILFKCVALFYFPEKILGLVFSWIGGYQRWLGLPVLVVGYLCFRFARELG